MYINSFSWRYFCTYVKVSQKYPAMNGKPELDLHPSFLFRIRLQGQHPSRGGAVIAMALKVQ